ncbi:hypothetical protein DXX93_12730 [Thalassotalea euphylliae]|uniref:Uncharacterized protein n=1 Tax=Thalassotalea euphylliae TaxID=1655234 RepID=A0A3E0TS87_9GAMM|nr:hypothetical protein DXX93_12715 [Thalassotalea euphylliae]REL27343.1 hypothetical protein DXX93_12730 [Thalassotalea euphylliae]
MGYQALALRHECRVAISRYNRLKFHLSASAEQDVDGVSKGSAVIWSPLGAVAITAIESALYY